jgi:hypothetical protein
MLPTRVATVIGVLFPAADGAGAAGILMGGRLVSAPVDVAALQAHGNRVVGAALLTLPMGALLALRLSIPASNPDDRLLDMLAIEDITPGRMLISGTILLLRARRPVPGIRVWHAPRLHVDADDQLEVTLDGEILGTLPGDFEIAGTPCASSPRSASMTSMTDASQHIGQGRRRVTAGPGRWRRR